MNKKKHFFSIKYKLLIVFIIIITIMMIAMSIMNYYFVYKDSLNIDFTYYFIRTIPFFSISFIIALIVLLWFLNNNLIRPINKLINVTSDFAYDTNDKREENVNRIFKLKYHKRKDELGKLYSAIAMTTRESMEFAEDIMKQTETITNMQNGLLMVIAEMVESRDECTGSHIKKTKAYVEIIINEMKKRGIYKDILTEKYAYNVINAAPLHDVGKIHIPDRILLGKQQLSDEEYKIMKTHTTYGAKMIQYAIDKIGGEDLGYLQEAKNVAEYHHEKWNGQGYPKGLKGEQIPLSARIMAVADVFDAAFSRRSYKEPMPFEDAINVIVDNSSTYFDPLIVEAFLGAKEEVRKIAHEFEENEFKN